MTELTYVQEMIIHYHKIFYYCCILAVIFGGISLILFMVFDIPNVVGELTGVSARKAIRKIEKSNEAATHHLQKKLFETGKGLSWEIGQNSTCNETMVLDAGTGEKTKVLDIMTEDVNATRVLDEEWRKQ